MRHDRAGNDRDTDFDAYVAARWPTLVRTLVLLGAPQPAAEEASRAALARCRRRWGRIRDTDDLDAEVYATLLASWARRRRHVPEPDAPDQPDQPGDPVEAALLLGRLEHQLDRLTTEQRACVVLRSAAGLDEAQVAGALDVRFDVVQEHVRSAVDLIRVEHPEGIEGLFRAAAAEVEVLAPPLPEVAAEASAQRRRSVRLVAVLIAGLLAVVGLGTWWGTRPAAPPEAADAPAVRRVESDSGIAWWANGVLHLRHVEVELPRVGGLVQVDDGAVYGDDTGGVFFVADSGRVTRIGTKSPAEPLVASDASGLAAWVDVSGASPEVIAYDVVAGQELLRRGAVVDLSRPIDDQARPIAMDGDSLYLADASGEHEWQLRSDVFGPVAGRGLVAVRNKVQVFQLNRRTIQIVQPFFNVSYAVRGDGALLSPNAAYALTRRPGSAGSDQFGTVRIYETSSGNRQWTGLDARDIAVAATLGPDDEAHYVIARAEDVPGSGEFVRASFSGPYEFRTCHISTRSCETVAQFPHTGELPVLSR